MKQNTMCKNPTANLFTLMKNNDFCSAYLLIEQLVAKADINIMNSNNYWKLKNYLIAQINKYKTYTVFQKSCPIYKT